MNSMMVKFAKMSKFLGLILKKYMHRNFGMDDFIQNF